MAKHHCCVCGRQFVGRDTTDETVTNSKGATFMGTGKYLCHACKVASHLDANGLFPEDYTFMTKEEIICFTKY